MVALWMINRPDASESPLRIRGCFDIAHLQRWSHLSQLRCQNTTLRQRARLGGLCHLSGTRVALLKPEPPSAPLLHGTCVTSGRPWLYFNHGDGCLYFCPMSQEYWLRGSVPVLCSMVAG